MPDPDETERRLDELEAFAREHGVVPAFKWPDQGEYVEACFLRLRWNERGGGMMVMQIGAKDGSWKDNYLIKGDHFEAAVREASGGLDDSDEPIDPGDHG